MKLEDVEILKVTVWKDRLGGASVSYRVRGVDVRGAYFRAALDELGAIAALYKYLEVSDE